MVSISTRLGPKGQIVIPKAFRDEYGFIAGEEVVIQDSPDGVLLAKKRIDLSNLAKRIATSSSKQITGIVAHSIYDQYEERWKRAKKHI